MAEYRNRCKCLKEPQFDVDIGSVAPENSPPMLKMILIGVGIAGVVLAGLVVAGLYLYPNPQIVSASQQVAPDFTLHDAAGQDFTLSSQRGHKVVLYFYRGYW